MKKQIYSVKSSTGLMRIKSLMCAFLLLLIFGNVNAQTLITVGTGSTNPSVGSNPGSGANGASPYGICVSSGAMGKKLQIIYTAAQINAAMTAAGYGGGASVISTVSWQISQNIGGSNYTHAGYTIKMANVAQTNFVSAATPYTGASTVVWGPTNQQYGASGTGYLVTHTLVTPFTWDGTSSLFVEVCYTIAGVGSASTYGGCVRTLTTGNNQMIYNGGAAINCATSTYPTVVQAIPNMRLTVAAACTAPATQAIAQAFSSLTTNSVQVNWTRGNGDAGVVVVAHATTAVSATPASGTNYVAGQNAAFGSGTNLGSNNYVVYAGTGTSVNVTGLSGATTYHFSVFEYNAATPIICYKTPGAVSSQYIPACLSFPTTNATSMVFSNITNNALTLSYTRGNGSNVMVVARLTATAQAQPTFNTSYTANTAFGSGQITGTGNFTVLNGTANTVTVTNLANLTAYTFDVYEYNASPNCYTTTPLIAGTSTLDGTTSGGCAASVVRTTGASAYTAIAPATVITSGGQITGYYQGGAINTPGAGIPIGFNFVYNGTTYSTFGLGVNGYVWFGSGVPSPTATYPIGNASANLGGSGTIDGIICAAGVQLNTQSYYNSGRSIGYTLSGTTPNRILTIQWKGYALGPGGTNCSDASFIDGNRLDFQIILNENGGTNSNKIGIAYQNMSPYCVSETGSSTIAQIGLRGSDNTSFTNRGGTMNFGGTDWGANAGAVNSASYNIGLSGNYIATNSLMTFTQAVTTGPTVNGFASGGSASNSCPATTVLLTAGTGFGSYQWFLNGSILPGPGSNSSTYTATQSGSYTVVGKSGTCYVQSNTFVVTINSCGVAPAITTCGSSVPQGNDAGLCSAVVNYTAATASGTPPPTITYSKNSGTVFNVGTTTVTVTASNGIGSDATCTFDVVVNDTEAPVADVATLSDATGECSASATAPTATDNCAGTITATTVDPTSYSSQGTFTIHWTYSDGNGNSSTQNQTVIVDDVTNPVPALAVLPDITGECSATATAPTATDNCAGTVTATTADPTSYNTQGSFVIHWTYDDGNGNTVTQNQNVIIDDITNPTINGCPGNITSCNPVVSWTAPTATDNCGTPSLASDHNPGETFSLGNTLVTYTADDGNGNTATCSFTVTVIANPTAVISNNSSICLGQPATVHLVFTGTGPWNYTVSDGSQTVSGSSAVTPKDINIIPPTTGVHNYTVTVLSDANCPGTGSGTASVAVSSTLPANSIGTVNGPGEACSGSVVLITTNTVAGQNITYSWNTGTYSSVVKFSTSAGGPFVTGPFSTSIPSVYVQFGALVGSSGYNICVQAVNGCGSTNNKCSWVRGIVGVPGNISGSVVACQNDVKNYSCGLSSGASLYTWTLSGSSSPVTSGQGSPNVSVTFPPAFTSGQLCVTAALACSGSSTSAPRCMTVSNTPAVPGSMTGPSKVCPGATGVAFSIPAVAGASGYNWTVPAGATITSGANTTAITVNFPASYTGAPPVCVYALSPCSTSAGRCKTVGTNLPGQPGSITGPTSGVCNSTVQYSINSVTLATSYTWTIPAGSTNFLGQGSTSIQFNVPPSPFASGQVSVVANTTACTPGTSAPRTITINGAPSLPGTISSFPSAWCDGGFVNFSITPASPLPLYQWIVTNGTIDAGQNTTNIDVTWGIGAGIVKVRATNSCGSSGYRTLNTSSVCRESSGFGQEDHLSVYPNPAHDKITVEMNNSIDEKAQINITDFTGKLIFTEQMQISMGITAIEIDLAHFAKGAYMISIIKASGVKRQSIMIQ